MDKKKQASWIEEKLKKVAEARKNALAQKGYGELMVFPVGESYIEIDMSQPPREAQTDNGIRDVLKLVTPANTDFMLNPTTKFAGMIYNALAEGKTKFTIVRTGEKKETRYAIKKAE